MPLNQYIGSGSLVFCRLCGGGSGFFQLLGTFWSPWAIPERMVASSWGRPFPSISGIFLKSNLICIKVLRFWLNEFSNIHMYIFKCAHQCIYSQMLLCTYEYPVSQLCRVEITVLCQHYLTVWKVEHSYPLLMQQRCTCMPAQIVCILDDLSLYKILHFRSALIYSNSNQPFRCSVSG